MKSEHLKINRAQSFKAVKLINISERLTCRKSKLGNKVLMTIYQVAQK